MKIIFKDVVLKYQVKVANNTTGRITSLLLPFPEKLRQHSVPFDFFFPLIGLLFNKKMPTCQESITVFLSFLKWGSSQMQPMDTQDLYTNTQQPDLQLLYCPIVQLAKLQSFWHTAFQSFTVSGKASCFGPCCFSTSPSTFYQGLIPSYNPGQIDLQVKWLEQLAYPLSFQVSFGRKKSMKEIYLKFFFPPIS